MTKTTRYRMLLALATGLLILLPVLAALQYHWLVQLSRSESVRMQANVDAAVQRLVDDIRQEVALVTRAFFLGVPRTAEVANELALRYEQWHALAPYPELLEAVYWVEVAEEEATLRLYRLHPERRTLEPAAWDGALETGRRRWQEIVQGHAPDASAPDTVPDVHAQPVLSLPVMRPPADEPEDDRLLYRDDLPIEGVVLLVLDQQRIVDTILPALVQTYFTHNNQRDYDLLIADRDDPTTILYRTSPKLRPADFHHPDATATFGFPEGPSFTVLSDSLPPLSNFLEGFSEGRTQGFIVRRDRIGGIARVRREPLAEEARAAQDPPLQVQRRPFRVWQVLVKHKDGSLEQVVAQARLRNLAISFGILLVLGGAILLIVFYARQMHHLASQQMAFVAGVSHELRTPIAVVQAAGENLQDGLIDDPGEARDYGKLIVGESRRLLDMVEQVLAFSGIAFGNKLPMDAEVHIEPLVEDALEALRPLLDENDATVEQHIEQGLPPVRGDAAALTAAVQNLLQNALKYGGAQPWIGLSARFVANGQEPEIHLAVADRGEGIASGEQTRIFEPFYRTPAALKSGIRGNGLGLSIVKNIVEAHGGRVEVSSTPGTGSRFTIRLKAAQPTHTKASR